MKLARPVDGHLCATPVHPEGGVATAPLRQADHRGEPADELPVRLERDRRHVDVAGGGEAALAVVEVECSLPGVPHGRARSPKDDLLVLLDDEARADALPSGQLDAPSRTEALVETPIREDPSQPTRSGDDDSSARADRDLFDVATRDRDDAADAKGRVPLARQQEPYHLRAAGDDDPLPRVEREVHPAPDIGRACERLLAPRVPVVSTTRVEARQRDPVEVPEADQRVAAGQRQERVHVARARARVPEPLLVSGRSGQPWQRECQHDESERVPHRVTGRIFVAANRSLDGHVTPATFGIRGEFVKDR